MAVVEVSEKHQDLIDELLDAVAAYNPSVDRELLIRAFQFAADAHEGQVRRSGEEFIRHPWNVAKNCAELRLDEQTIAAALLHDTVEDTGVELDQIKDEFGEEIAQLVEGVTKLTRIQFQSREQAEAENYRKMIVAMADDPRVIPIKLADRLHNMRTIRCIRASTTRSRRSSASVARTVTRTSRRPPTRCASSWRRSTSPRTSPRARSTSTRSTRR